MIILALDPGTTETGWCLYDTDGPAVIDHATQPNEQVRVMLHLLRGDVSPMVRPQLLAVERFASYGMAVGQEVFDTCEWAGRFVEAWGGRVERVFRRDVKSELCHSQQAGDSNVRQAILDRFPRTGGGKTPQVGTKGQPGPLYGMSGDMWAALGVAVVAAARMRAGVAA